MTFYIPWILIAIFISLFLFYQTSAQSRRGNEDRREELNKRRQEYLNQLLKIKEDPKNENSNDNDKKNNLAE